jgi:cytochrome d ubiquinol oxidase subunit II
MSYEVLQTIWFVLIAILWIGFFFLEGFDFGVGMLLPFLGKKDEERRAIINAIGPHWDGNEVWLLTAGGATFAAFPQWYATLFSGFYPALFLLLIGLILRGVAFEFRSKDANPKWRTLWDWVIFIGSFLPALLLGIAFANLARGVPIDSTMTYTGNLLTLLNPYGLLGGLMTVAAFLLHGALFTTLKVEGIISERATAFTRKIWIVVVVLSILMVIATYFYTDLVERLGLDTGVIPLAGVAAILLSRLFIYRNQFGWAFVMTSLMVVLTVATSFLIMFPRVMISTIDPAFSLTISNASSSQYTLTVMTIVAAIFTPIVLIYQGWTYWVFRKRIVADPQKLIY